MPYDSTYNFDQEQDSSNIVKTTIRQKVISRAYGRFQGREKVRNFPKDTRLSSLVPKHANYCYDIISAVGVGSFIEGRKLSDIHQELQDRIPNFAIPYSSLYDQQRKFLFYFGLLHQSSMPLIQEYLASSGKIGWLIDGTLEPGTDVFFGVQDCQKDIMLDCRNIATENEKEMTKFLVDVGNNFGHPHQIIHDVRRAISNACHAAFEDVIQMVCHRHFTKNIGKALYDTPYEMLYNHMKKLRFKIQLALRHLLWKKALPSGMVR